MFRKAKLAVFVDGDFWHGWRLPAWEHKLSPFWRDKLRANRARDQRNFRRLRADGWRVVRIWQHELARDSSRCIQRVLDSLLDSTSIPNGLLNESFRAVRVAAHHRVL